MEKFKSFMKTTFFGGVLVLLPIGFLGFLIGITVNSIWKAIRPLTDVLTSTLGLSDYAAVPIVVITVVLVCFLVGVLAKMKLTGKVSAAIGGRPLNWALDTLEDRIQKAVPRYVTSKRPLPK